LQRAKRCEKSGKSVKPEGQKLRESGVQEVVKNLGGENGSPSRGNETWWGLKFFQITKKFGVGPGHALNAAERVQKRVVQMTPPKSWEQGSVPCHATLG